MRKNNFNTMYLYIFNLTLFVVGFVYGMIIYKDYSTLIDQSYIEQYFNSDSFTEKPSLIMLLSKFVNEFSYYFLLWFLSLTVVGIVMVIFVVFFVGFIYGFTYSYFINSYGFKGLSMFLLYTFPKNLFLIPLIIYFVTHSIILSLQLMLSIYYNYNKKNIKLIVNKHFNLLFFIIIVLIVYILTDAIFLRLRINKLITLL